MNQEILNFIDKYVKEIKDNSAAMFIGAGFSKSAGYVDWKNLLKAVLFADSENSRKSMWVAYELQYAEKTHKPIYTVGFDGMKEINELKDYWFRNIRVEKVPL